MNESVSIIIPAFRLSGLRLRNFNAVLASVLRAPFAEVIVVEQTNPGAMWGELDLPEGVTHLRMPIRDTKIRKPMLLTLGVDHAKTEYVWLNDADVYVPFKSVLEQLTDEDEAVVPYHHCVQLPEALTRLFIAREPIVCPESTPSIFVPGGGAVIMRKSMYEAVGGYDEEARGHGPYDAEFWLRVEAQCSTRVLTNTGYHLHHPINVPANRADSVDNELLYHSTRKRLAGDIDLPKLEIIRQPEYFPVLPVLTKPAEQLPSTALLLTAYGNNDQRNTSVRMALAQLGRLDPLPNVYLLELGHSPCGDFSDVGDLIPGAVYHYRQLDDRYRGIFCKESAFNWMEKHLIDDEEDLILHDIDTYPTRSEWAEMTSAMLKVFPAGQPWRKYQDTRDPAFLAYSRSSAPAYGWKNRSNPGLSWAMRREFFHKIGGLNNKGLCGAGDTILVSELRADPGQRAYINRWDYTRHHHRELPVTLIAPGYTDVDMVHCWHGDRNDRGHSVRHDLIDHWHPIEDHIEQDSFGFLRFKVAGCPLQEAMLRRAEAHDSKTIINLIRDIGSTRPVDIRGRYPSDTGVER